eukprot:2150321-Amphidinium_carterae.2
MDMKTGRCGFAEPHEVHELICMMTQQGMTCERCMNLHLVTPLHLQRATSVDSWIRQGEVVTLLIFWSLGGLRPKMAVPFLHHITSRTQLSQSQLLLGSDHSDLA